MAFITALKRRSRKSPPWSCGTWTSPLISLQTTATNVYNYGAVPHIVWEPWIWGDEEKIKLDNIINGEWDEYMKNGRRMPTLSGKPIFIRWGHEFNMEKYPWGIVNNGKDPQKYVKAFRHVHDIFTKAGATNIKWIWCFNNYPIPERELERLGLGLSRRRLRGLDRDRRL